MDENNSNNLNDSFTTQEELIYNAIMLVSRKVDKLDQKIDAVKEELREEFRTELAKVKEELREEFRTELAKVKEELREEFRTELAKVKEELREEFRTELAKTKDEILKEVSGFINKDIVQEIVTKKEFKELESRVIVLEQLAFPQTYSINEDTQDYDITNNTDDE